MSDRKYKPRTSKKRKFCGNQHTRKSKTPRSSLTEQDIQINSVLSDQETSIDLDLDLDVSSVSNSVSTPNLSRSEKKLGLNFDDTINDSSDDSDSENVHSSDYNNFGNRIIDISILRNQIADQLRCRYCNGKVELQEVNRQGLGSTLQGISGGPAPLIQNGNRFHGNQ